MNHMRYCISELAAELLDDAVVAVPPVYNIVPQYGTKIPAPPVKTRHRPILAGEAEPFQTVSSVFDPPGSPYAWHLSLADPFNFVAGSTLIKILRTQSCLVSSLVSKLYYIYIGVSDQS